jgi:hypothetical protein
VAKWIRRKHTPTFKARAVLAALKGEKRWPRWPDGLAFTGTISPVGSAPLRPLRGGVVVHLTVLIAKIGERALEKNFRPARSARPAC